MADLKGAGELAGVIVEGHAHLVAVRGPGHTGSGERSMNAEVEEERRFHSAVAEEGGAEDLGGEVGEKGGSRSNAAEVEGEGRHGNFVVQGVEGRW
ncbi:hypothetical protein EMPG_13751, partial [Blastomyces silverae]